MKYGWCVDAVLKNHMMTFPKTPVYMYYFTHRSEYEVIPRWMGESYLCSIFMIIS